MCVLLAQRVRLFNSIAALCYDDVIAGADTGDRGPAPPPTRAHERRRGDASAQQERAADTARRRRRKTQRC